MEGKTALESMMNRNGLKLYAVNRDHKSGFDIYLGYPGGKKEYVRTSRHNGLLYGIMCGGVRVEDMRRWLIGETKLPGIGDKRSRARSAAHVEGSIRQILKLVDEMVMDKEYEAISLNSLAARIRMREQGRWEI